MWAALDIEWCCEGRHGVIRSVPKAEIGAVQEAINYFMGHGGSWWTGTKRSKKRSVEFVAMTKVFPAPRKPWEWCGETVLYPDWKERVAADRLAREQFVRGDAVTFEHKGVEKRGAFSHFTRAGRAAVLVMGEGQWTLPPSAMTKVWP